MIIQATDRLIVRAPIGCVAFMGGTWATPPAFTRAYGKLIAHAYENLLEPHQVLDQIDASVSYHEGARNYLAARFMGDWILMLDTDHEFEPDMLARMLGIINKWDVDVLTAVYRLKTPPYLPNLYGWDPDTRSFTRIAELDWTQTLAQIYCAGAGSLLVRRKVFDRIRDELKQEPFTCLPSPNDPNKNLSEDFSFFYRCMKLGIKTWAAPQIESGHLVARSITHRDYEPSAVETVDVKTIGLE